MPDTSVDHARTAYKDAIRHLPLDALREAVVRRIVTAAETDITGLFESDGSLRPAPTWPAGQEVSRLVITETMINGVKTDERRHFVFTTLEDSLDILVKELPDRTPTPEQLELAARLQRAMIRCGIDKEIREVDRERKEIEEESRMREEYRYVWAQAALGWPKAKKSGKS